MCISDERIVQLNKFQEKYSLKFKNLNLLNQAFVHSSYVKEKNLDISKSYERLEFFGDAVLKLAISDFLYNHFTNFQEGELTKLRAEIVSDENIFRYAQKLGFCDLIILGKNEKKQGGASKHSILACAFEALLGAIYVEYAEKGYETAKNFLQNNFIDDILSFEKNIDTMNPKAILQEYTQGKDKKLPEYHIIKTSGEDHNKTFFAEVIYENKIIGSGSAKTIKKAHQEAAYNALVKLKIIKEDKE